MLCYVSRLNRGDVKRASWRRSIGAQGLAGDGRSRLARDRIRCWPTILLGQVERDDFEFSGAGSVDERELGVSDGRRWERRGTTCRIGLGKLTFTYENLLSSSFPR